MWYNGCIKLDCYIKGEFTITIYELLKGTVKNCSILVAALIGSSLIITKTSVDILIIILVGWFTALLNFFLLAFVVYMMKDKKKIWATLPIIPLRYGLYAISMLWCIDGVTSGLWWTGGVMCVIIAIMVSGIKSEKRKEGNL